MELQDWIGVLAISSKYCIQAGIEQSLSALMKPSGTLRFEPCFKLRLAWEYMIEDWYEECLLDILALPPMELRVDDMNDVEAEVFAALLATRTRVARHPLELIPFIPDAAHDLSCTDRGRCSRDWTSAYSHAMLYFAHTRRFYTGREVFDKLKKIEPPVIYEDCRRLSIQEVENKGVLWKEETFIRAGTENIKKLLKSARPKSARPIPRFFESGERGTRDGFYII